MIPASVGLIKVNTCKYLLQLVLLMALIICFLFLFLVKLLLQIQELLEEN